MMVKESLGNLVLEFFLSAILHLILLFPLLSIVVFFCIYRLAVYAILLIKFGPKFWGFLYGIDQYFSIEGPSKNLICILMTARSKSSFEDFMKKFTNQVKTKILENPQSFSKLLATRHQAFGFHYLIKDQVKIDDCIRPLKVSTENEEICKEELLTKLDNCFSDPLPYNHTGLWELLVCETPLKCNKATDNIEQTYAILVRIHHSLCDGISLLKCFNEILADFNQHEDIQNFLKPSQNLLVRLLIYFQDILTSAFLVLIAPISILKQILNLKFAKNSLHFSKLTNENFLVEKVEDTSECLQIIKRIKKKTNSSFNDVLMAAVSKSFSYYFQTKNKDPNLTSILACITAISRNSQLSLTKEESIQLHNNFAVITFAFPIIYRKDDQFRSKSSLETLEAVKKEFQNVKNSYNSQIQDGFFKLLNSLFPEWVLQKIFANQPITLFITNVPGPSSPIYWAGCLIEDITFWIPVVQRTGVSLSIFSYDKRLQIALTANKALISKREDAQSLVDGIHKAILEMDSEI